MSQLEDSGTPRIKTILHLIKSSKYSIHDLSRMKSEAANELARFNMPFELGLELGMKSIAGNKMKNKKCLVLDTERHRYHAAISDLSGSDIASYGKQEQVERLIKVLRDWFTHVVNPKQPPANKVFLEYNEFVSDLQIELMAAEFSQRDIDNLSNAEYIHYAGEWVGSRLQ